MENPIKIDDLGVPLFLETPICCPSSSLEHQNPEMFTQNPEMSTSAPRHSFWVSCIWSPLKSPLFSGLICFFGSQILLVKVLLDLKISLWHFESWLPGIVLVSINGDESIIVPQARPVEPLISLGEAVLTGAGRIIMIEWFLDFSMFTTTGLSTAHDLFPVWHNCCILSCTTNDLSMICWGKK